MLDDVLTAVDVFEAAEALQHDLVGRSLRADGSAAAGRRGRFSHHVATATIYWVRAVAQQGLIVILRATLATSGLVGGLALGIGSRARVHHGQKLAIGLATEGRIVYAALGLELVSIPLQVDLKTADATGSRTHGRCKNSIS